MYNPLFRRRGEQKVHARIVVSIVAFLPKALGRIARFRIRPSVNRENFMQALRRRRQNTWVVGVALSAVAALAQAGSVSAISPPSSVAKSAPRVLQVGTYRGHKGAYSTIQSAVNGARPGDWILIAPGDYHEQGTPQAGVFVTTPSIHLRGMDRNSVVVDGTKPGASRCSADPDAQEFGASGGGRNGIEIFQVDGVSVENLTACNFHGDANGNQGNQIWWNGGDGSGQIGMGSYHGAYLTASSTFYQAGRPTLAQYGIFVSNARGPGVIDHAYASNMSDSAFYIGACADCNAVLRNVHAQNSAQGYSGSNSGGHLVLENSEWDHNQAGIVPSSLAGADPPSPQDGACPNQPGKSCTLIQYNYVHDNNNPNTPAAGLAATVPVGTGIDLTGGHNNTVQFNLVSDNASWGILLNDYADSTPSDGSAGYCRGGTADFNTPSPFDQLYGPLIPCFFSSFGNHIEGNLFLGNGSFGNATNGDLGNAALAYPINNCFDDNVDLANGSPSSSPANLQKPSVAGVCGEPWKPNTAQEFLLIEQLGCASLGPASGACAGLPPPLYPLQTQVQLLPIPREPSMSNPCAGVPASSWCEQGP